MGANCCILCPQERMVLMRLCGFAVSSGDLVGVVLEKKEDNWMVVDTSPSKLTIDDIFKTENVRSFSQLVTAYLRDNLVDHVVIRRLATGGKFAGGASAFCIGAIVQLSTDKPVNFISSRSIALEFKKHSCKIPASLYKYQHDAYKTATAYIAKELGR